MKIVAITWNDAHSSDDWRSAPDAYEPCLVTSCGYLREYEHGVVIISNYCPAMPETGEHCYGVTHIPKGCIVRTLLLKDD